MKSDISWTTWRTPEQSNLIPRDLEKPGAYCTRFFVCLACTGSSELPVSSARKVEEAYRSFLKSARDQMQCGADTSVHLQPTHVVDIFWHTHILFTRKYFKDCEAVFGQYLHHEPVLLSQ